MYYTFSCTDRVIKPFKMLLKQKVHNQSTQYLNRLWAQAFSQHSTTKQLTKMDIYTN